MKPLNVAIVGFGSMGKKHKNTIQAVEDINIVGIVDPLASLNSDVLIYEKMDDLLNSERVDCAIVSTPTHSHYEMTKKLVERGINVLIEKPVTSSTTQAQNLLHLQKDSGLKIAVGHVERFNPAIQALIKDDLRSQNIINCNTYY